MQKTILAVAAAAAAVAGLSAPASACPNGYKAVWIQGNKVCMIDASASNSLASPDGGGGIYKQIKTIKLKR